jgi:hypothetical protein
MTAQTKSELSEYDIQARNFLEGTKTDIQIEYHDYNYHFEGDKDKRDIYSVVLKRGNREYAFKFGQSLAESGYFLKRKHDDKDPERQVLEGNKYFFVTDDRKIGEAHGIKAACFSKGVKVAGFDKWVCRTRAGRDHWLYCGFGKGWDSYKKQPSEYRILARLVPHDPGTFEEFCWNYGYSEDSIKALKVYNTVSDEFKSLCTLYTDAELSMLGEIL